MRNAPAMLQVDIGTQQRIFLVLIGQADMAGKGIATPSGAIEAFGYLLEYCGHFETGNRLVNAVHDCIAAGEKTDYIFFTDADVAVEFADKFPAPEKLWTIDDLGGWGVVDPELFAKETGKIAVIYEAATS